MPTLSDRSCLRAVVCVPARNEEQHLPALIGSLAAQSAITAARPLKVVLVCNNSTDASVALARDMARSHAARLDVEVMDVELPPATAHVGTARRMAMDAGAAWLEAAGIEDGALICTDADAVAPTHWIAANLDALRQADAVGGRLVISPDAGTVTSMGDLHARVERYWQAVRDLEDHIDPPPHDPSPRHGDHTGASLAVRLGMYRRVGGLPPLSSGEDNALVAAIERLGGVVRHDPDVWIAVSARENGRAVGGMAAEMMRRRALVSCGGDYMLPSATFWQRRLEQRGRQRRAWIDCHRGAVPAPGFGGSLDPIAFDSVIAYLAACETAAPLVDDQPWQNIDVAIADLEAMARTETLV